MFHKLIERIEQRLRTIISDEVHMIVKHREPVGNPDQTRRIVKLILDLHDRKWSIETDAFLRELNIDPTEYWQRYMRRKS